MLDTGRKIDYIIGVKVSTREWQVLKNDNERRATVSNKELSERKRRILRAIVDAHISNGEPVGSKYVSSTTQINCSPATIRNEMAELEEMGYLIQPHTSAGRIPSELGYRFYIDSLVKHYSEKRDEIEVIHERLKHKLTEMDEILEEVSRLASTFTNYTGIAFKAGLGQVRVEKFDSVYLSPKDFLLVMLFSGDIVKAKPIHLPFSITEDDLKRFTEALSIYLTNSTSDGITMPLIIKIESIMGSAGAMVHPTMKIIYETMNELDTADIKLDGVTRLLQYPEYSDVSKLRDLMGMLEEKGRLMDVISSGVSSHDDIQVYIGREDDDAMRDTTLIYKMVDIGGKSVAIGVIGPRRMDYSKVIAMIYQLAGAIGDSTNDTRLLGEGNEGKDD